MPTFSLPGVGYTLRALITMETFKLNAGKELEVWLNVLQLQHALTENISRGNWLLRFSVCYTTYNMCKC